MTRTTTRLKSIPSTFINHPEISLGAKWLFAFINLKPQSWEANSYTIAEETQEGYTTISAYILELFENEYLENKPTDKFIEIDWEKKQLFEFFLLTKTVKKETEIGRADRKKVFAYWNTKGICVHKTMTDDIIYQIDKTLETYHIGDIYQAIDNYTAIYKSKITYWEHKWTLKEFLQRSGWMSVFLYKSEKDYIDKSKIETAAAKTLIAEETNQKKTVEWIEEKKRQQETEIEEQELRKYFQDLPDEQKKKIIETAIESIKEKEGLKETHSYLYNIYKKAAVKKATYDHRDNS
jgi:hypothetical protein